ncbi:MAG TPA: hypothetical protein VN226_00880 [Anaerolineales bacterium]|nr:hypothetical protein [Anaerolineales bacterium]
MSLLAQESFSKLSRTRIDPMWSGKPNEWIRSLPPARIGIIGEDLALSILGGIKAKNNSVGYDLNSEGRLIEVKLSTVVLMNSGKSPTLCWRQIRPSDPYTHIFFVAVYPSDARVFLVPRGEIPVENLVYQHGRGKSIEIFQISTVKLSELFPWMVRYEIK